MGTGVGIAVGIVVGLGVGSDVAVADSGSCGGAMVAGAAVGVVIDSSPVPARIMYWPQPFRVRVITIVTAKILGIAFVFMEFILSVVEFAFANSKHTLSWRRKVSP